VSVKKERRTGGFFGGNRSDNCSCTVRTGNTVNMRHDHNYILLKINGEAMQGLRDLGPLGQSLSPIWPRDCSSK